MRVQVNTIKTTINFSSITVNQLFMSLITGSGIILSGWNMKGH